jgi:acetoin utilization deacetylase AcuC-like enzyme
MAPFDIDSCNRGISQMSDENMKNQTGIVYSDTYLEHETGGHPESPRRLTAIMDGLESRGILRDLVRVDPLPARPEEIELVHKPSYIKWVEDMVNRGETVLDFGDTVVSEGSYEAARLAAGGVIAAVDAVMEGRVRNCFCAVRPPGHHALYDRAMGFCLFNNVAIGARYLQKRYGIERVLIVDWDVHHGNGTQDTFYGDPSVFYFSSHQHPHYPGSGSAGETGEGAGEGFTLNAPLSSGSGDEEYLRVFSEKLAPAMDKFQPEFVFISAGFDGHRSDPLSSINLTGKGFGRLTAVVNGIAEKYAAGRLVSVLEGGYDLDGLSDSVAEHLLELLGGESR